MLETYIELSTQIIETIETEDDTLYKVPVSMLRESVLPRSPIPFTNRTINALPTKEEIEKSAHLWDGAEITIQHPSRGGRKVIGNVVEPYMDGDKLKGYGLLSVNAMDSFDLGRDIKIDVEQGNAIEVSTGYFADTVMENGKHNGESYDGLHTNIRPDHLAVLPSRTREVGKCSVSDGCGMMVNSTWDKRLKQNILDVARDMDSVDYDGVESIGDQKWEEVNKDIKDYVEGFFEHTENSRDDFDQESFNQVSELPEEMKEWIAQKSLLGDPESDTFDELLYFPVVNPATNKLSEGALFSIVTGRGAQADISPATLEGSRGVARTFLETEFDRDFSENSMFNVMESLKGLYQDLKQSFIKNSHERECECDMDLEYLAKNSRFSKQCVENMNESEQKLLLDAVKKSVKAGEEAAIENAVHEHRQALVDLVNAGMKLKEVAVGLDVDEYELEQIMTGHINIAPDGLLEELRAIEPETDMDNDNEQENSQEGGADMDEKELKELKDQVQENSETLGSISESIENLSESMQALNSEDEEPDDEPETDGVENADEEPELSEVAQSLADDERIPFGPEELANKSDDELKDLAGLLQNSETEEEAGNGVFQGKGFTQNFGQGEIENADSEKWDSYKPRTVSMAGKDGQ